MKEWGMQKARLMIVVACLVVIPSMLCGASLTITEIRANTQIQGAEFSLNLGPLAVTGGIDGIFLQADIFDSLGIADGDRVIASAQGMILMPTVGVKLFLGKKPARMFVKAALYNIIPVIDAEFSVGDHSVISQQDVDEIQERIDALYLYGTKIGLGMEYQFNKHLALVGEAGIRSNSASFDVLKFFGTDSPDTEVRLDGMLAHTYTALGITFYL